MEDSVRLYTTWGTNRNEEHPPKIKRKTNQSIRQKQIAFPNIASTTMDDGERYQRPPGAQKHRL